MKMSFGKALLLVGAAAMLAPVAGAAQGVRDLDNERSDVLTFEGEVTTEPVLFRYTIPPQTSVVIDAVPTENSDLDPTMIVTDLASGEVLVDDDDGGDGLASRGRIYSEDGQRIEIAVSAYAFFSGEESSGAFQLTLRPSEYRPQPMRAIGYGDEVSGSLNPSDTQLFSIEGEEGQLLQVALIADDDGLDPYLSIYKGTDTEAEPFQTNDDGGDGLNSLLRIVLPDSGTYTIEAKPYGESSGDYTLRVAQARTHNVQSPQQVLGLDERMSGFLGSGYETGSLDPAEITYQLTAEAIATIRGGDGEVTFNMSTPLFDDESFPSGVDSYLGLGFETPLGFASMMNDDDGGEGLNSRIAIDLSPIASDGDWLERLRIRASSIGQGGAYEIEMVEGMQAVENAYFEGDEMPMVSPAPSTEPEEARD